MPKDKQLIAQKDWCIGALVVSRAGAAAARGHTCGIGRLLLQNVRF